MSNNSLPSSIDKLFSLAEKMADGCHAHQQALGIMHKPEAIIRTKLEAARNAESTYQAGKAEKLTATGAQGAADENAKKFIVTARDVLKPVLGASWSQAWEQTGFPGRSLAVPRTLDERVELVKSLELYFARNAGHENEPLGVTSAEAHALHEAFSTRQSGSNSSRGELQGKRDERDEAVADLRKQMRGLIAELTVLLDDDDGRWLDFGLTTPAANHLPEVPEGLVVSGAGSGHLLAAWAASPRAARYRIYKQVVGANEDFILAATVTETSVNLNTFTPTAHVRVKVAAVNDAGESLPSEPVEQVVP